MKYKLYRGIDLIDSEESYFLVDTEKEKVGVVFTWAFMGIEDVVGAAKVSFEDEDIDEPLKEHQESISQSELIGEWD